MSSVARERRRNKERTRLSIIGTYAAIDSNAHAEHKRPVSRLLMSLFIELNENASNRESERVTDIFK
jgi:hypothetical protein